MIAKIDHRGAGITVYSAVELRLRNDAGVKCCHAVDYRRLIWIAPPSEFQLRECIVEKRRPCLRSQLPRHGSRAAIAIQINAERGALIDHTGICVKICRG